MRSVVVRNGYRRRCQVRPSRNLCRSGEAMPYFRIGPCIVRGDGTYFPDLIKYMNERFYTTRHRVAHGVYDQTDGSSLHMWRCSRCGNLTTLVLYSDVDQLYCIGVAWLTGGPPKECTNDYDHKPVSS